MTEWNDDTHVMHNDTGTCTIVWNDDTHVMHNDTGTCTIVWNDDTHVMHNDTGTCTIVWNDDTHVMHNDTGTCTIVWNDDTHVMHNDTGTCTIVWNDDTHVMHNDTGTCTIVWNDDTHVMHNDTGTCTIVWNDDTHVMHNDTGTCTIVLLQHCYLLKYLFLCITGLLIYSFGRKRVNLCLLYSIYVVLNMHTVHFIMNKWPKAAANYYICIYPYLLQCINILTNVPEMTLLPLFSCILLRYCFLVVADLWYLISLLGMRTSVVGVWTAVGILSPIVRIKLIMTTGQCLSWHRLATWLDPIRMSFFLISLSCYVIL